MQGRPWPLRPGPLAVVLSTLAHAVLVTAAMWLTHGAGAPGPRGPFTVDTVAYLADDAAVSEGAEEAEAGEQPADVFRFAASESQGPLLPEGPVPTISDGSDDSPADGGNGPGFARPAAGPPVMFRGADAARSVVYVIDRSISMGLKGALDDARQELLDSLARLAPSTQFQVIFYNREAQPLILTGRRGLVPATDAVLREATAAVAAVQAEGSTNHPGALRQALLLEPEVVYLVTDADDMTAEQVRTVTSLNRGRSAIHAIHLGNAREGPALRELARTNRGTYRTVAIR